MKTVSVVIPSYCQPLLLTKCVTSVRSQGKRVVDIVVIDDHSNEETQEVTKHLDGIRPFFNAGNSGFTKNVNRGVKKTNTDYVLILNSDVELLPNCIENMAINLDDGAGACGALLFYPQNHPHPQLRGRVQHAGVGFASDGVPYHVFAQFHPRSPAVNTWRSINAVTGAALMTRRDVWDKINGFDERYSPGIYEDIDYCMSVKKIGQEVIYDPGAQALHYEHGSQTQGGNWFNQGHLEKNLSSLFMKHGVPRCDDALFYKVR